ncbi:MAG: SIS domain-containing protein [Halanaerobiales bacterium]
MYYTKKEIFSQYEALEKTFQYLKNRKKDLNKFRDCINVNSVSFTGAGSSYCLCVSGEISTKIHTDYPANAFAAGDLMLNYSHYKNIIKDTLLIAPSRSGSTSEVIKSVKKARKDFSIPLISISAREDSDLSTQADMNLIIPWAFDESVCQTRTVTNLYLAQLFLIAVLGENNKIIAEMDKVIKKGKKYLEKNKINLKKIGQDESWNKVIVLGDSELEGIAAEAAIAFKEIPQIPSNYYHILDVRHGPMVLVDENTLVIMACTPLDKTYQKDLVKDLREKGAQVVTVSDSRNNIFDSEYNITVPSVENYGVTGIPFILVPQIIAYYKAVSRDINPDQPESLDPWIEL